MTNRLSTFPSRHQLCIKAWAAISILSVRAVQVARRLGEAIPTTRNQTADRFLSDGPDHDPLQEQRLSRNAAPDGPAPGCLEDHRSSG